MGFLVDEVALQQLFVRDLQFYPFNHHFITASSSFITAPLGVR
jgi:hypothetical protein